MNQPLYRTGAYTGVNAPTPPTVILGDRDPGLGDSKNYKLGDIWMTHEVSALKVWMLVRSYLSHASADLVLWVNLYPEDSGGLLTANCDTGSATQVAGVMNVLGNGVSFTTVGVDNEVGITTTPEVALIYHGDTGPDAVAIDNELIIVGDFADELYVDSFAPAQMKIVAGDAFPYNYLTDAGTANANGSGELEILGDSVVVETNAPVLDNQVIIGIKDSAMTRPDIIIGSGGATNPVWGTLLSSNNSITITYRDDLEDWPVIDLAQANGPVEDGAFGGHLFYATLAASSTFTVGSSMGPGFNWYWQNIPRTVPTRTQYSPINIIVNEGDHWVSPQLDVSNPYRSGYYVCPVDGFYRVTAALRIAYTTSESFGSVGPPFKRTQIHSGVPGYNPGGGPGWNSDALFYSGRTQRLTLDRIGYFTAGTGINFYTINGFPRGSITFYEGGDSFLCIYYVSM